jgi:death-on-curing protein
VRKPRWIHKDALLFGHAEALAEHGGIEGLRDEGLLEPALARPKNAYAYEGTTDIARLAAAYAFVLARNHPFVDGNKRAAFLAIGLFLDLNGYALEADQAEATRIILGLAERKIDEQELTVWIREHLTPSPDSE